jgi:hypothetical protein
VSTREKERRVAKLKTTELLLLPEYLQRRQLNKKEMKIINENEKRSSKKNLKQITFIILGNF